MRETMRQMILPVIGGVLIAVLTACVFWLVGQYLL